MKDRAPDACADAPEPPRRLGIGKKVVRQHGVQIEDGVAVESDVLRLLPEFNQACGYRAGNRCCPPDGSSSTTGLSEAGSIPVLQRCRRVVRRFLFRRTPIAPAAPCPRDRSSHRVIAIEAVAVVADWLASSGRLPDIVPDFLACFGQLKHRREPRTDGGDSANPGQAVACPVTGSGPYQALVIDEGFQSVLQGPKRQCHVQCIRVLWRGHALGLLSHHSFDCLKAFFTNASCQVSTPACVLSAMRKIDGLGAIIDRTRRFTCV